MVQQVYAQAKLLTGAEDAGQQELLRLLCQAAVSALTARLRPDLSPEDCSADFIAAGTLFAIAAYSEADPQRSFEQVQLGDITVRPGGGTAAAQCLRQQAAQMIAPYCGDSFCFRGV